MNSSDKLKEWPTRTLLKRKPVPYQTNTFHASGFFQESSTGTGSFLHFSDWLQLCATISDWLSKSITPLSLAGIM